MVNRYGPWLDTNTCIPTGQFSCRVIFDYYLDKEAVQEDVDGTSAGKKKNSSIDIDSYVKESLVASDKVQYTI